jgi:hypothetical protein
LSRDLRRTGHLYCPNNVIESRVTKKSTVIIRMEDATTA